MPDRDDVTATPIEPDVPTVIDIPADLLGRCRSRHPDRESLRCRRHAHYDGPHESGSGESWPDPHPPAVPAEPDLPALREIYARQIEPAMRATLETILQLHLGVVREAPTVAQKLAGGIDAELAAAAVDLRQVERFLRIIGDSEGHALDQRERRLADLALKLARPCGEVASRLEYAVVAEGERP